MSVIYLGGLQQDWEPLFTPWEQDGLMPLPLLGQPMTFPPEALWVTVGLSVCLVILLVALAFVCWRKIKQSCEEENAGEGA